MPGADKPAGFKNTRERQDTLKREGVLGLERYNRYQQSHMENGEQNLGRIRSSNCVQSVAHIPTCHKPSLTHGLDQITESYFFYLKAMEQVKVSENGDMTFIIDTALPDCLCRSHRRE